MEIKKLNLGCGEFKKEGYVNLDWQPTTKPDVLHDLNVFPYPFDGDVFDLIEADHVLEHLDKPFEVMKELHRIAKKGAKVIIKVPHFSRGFTHPEHKRGFDITFPLYFDSSFKGGYQGVEFGLKNLRLTWFAQKYLKKQSMPSVLYALGILGDWLFSFLANLSPPLCSRIWCFWVGGFEEIRFELICKK